MKIKVLTSGCPTCEQMYTNVKEIIAELKLDVSLEKVEDITQIMSYQIMSLPALVIDDKVVLTGSSTKEELKRYFQ